MVKYRVYGRMEQDVLPDGTIHMYRFIGYVMMNAGHIFYD